MLTIRVAGERDLPAVGGLHHRARALAYAGFAPAGALASSTPRGAAEHWARRWRSGRDVNRLAVAEDEGELIGFTYVGPDAEPGTGVLFAIHVDPAVQGQGVGSALMADVLGVFGARGWRRAVLWVFAANTHARRFYERGGWSPDGAARDGYLGPATLTQLRYTRPLPLP